MDKLAELTLLFALTAGLAAVLGVRAIVELGRRRGREVELALACPRSGARVACTLVYDDDAAIYKDVVACSAKPGDAPGCDEACRKLLNLGVPLRPD